MICIAKRVIDFVLKNFYFLCQVFKLALVLNTKLDTTYSNEIQFIYSHSAEYCNFLTELHIMTCTKSIFTLWKEPIFLKVEISA